jgi:ATP-dependent DNA ligase
VFEFVRRARHGGDAVLCAFDLIELEGEDLRRTPIEDRKRRLAKLVRTPHPGIVLNEHYEGDGEIVFQHACRLGCEGIVSKRLGSLYRSGRVDCWVKVKNPKAPAVKRALVDRRLIIVRDGLSVAPKSSRLRERPRKIGADNRAPRRFPPTN